MPSRKLKPKKIEVPAPKKPSGRVESPGMYKIPKSKVRPYTMENVADEPNGDLNPGSSKSNLSD